MVLQSLGSSLVLLIACQHLITLHRFLDQMLGFETSFTTWPSRPRVSSSSSHHQSGMACFSFQGSLAERAIRLARFIWLMSSIMRFLHLNPSSQSLRSPPTSVVVFHMLTSRLVEGLLMRLGRLLQLTRMRRPPGLLQQRLTISRRPFLQSSLALRKHRSCLTALNVR